MGLCVNEFAGTEAWACPTTGATTSATGEACTLTGDQVLAQLGFGSFNLGDAFGGLIGLAVGFNLIGYLCLRFVHRPRFMALNPAEAAAPWWRRAVCCGRA